MYNADIRAVARQNGVYLYAVAARLGISESTMMRLLRHELTKAKRAQIFKIIDELSPVRKN